MSTNESALAGLKVGDLIETGANGRWAAPARVIRVEAPFVSGYGGIARTVEWESGTGTISACFGSRELGRFWRVAQ